MYKMIKELELSNEDNFIKCFDHLYQDITSDYDFGSTMKKIIVKEEAKRMDYSFLCCLLPCSFNDTDFVYSNYTRLENAIYNILYVNNIAISKKRDISIEFIIAKSHDEIIENCIKEFGSEIDSPNPSLTIKNQIKILSDEKLVAYYHGYKITTKGKSAL